MRRNEMRGSPAQERAICPNCGKKTLGNIYVGRFPEGVFSYRQCGGRGHCEHVVKISPAKLPVARDNFPKNKVERNVFALYLAGSERGQLFRYVEQGKSGLPSPDRSNSAAYAAWRAGRELAGVA
jgi:hypothetical protein